MTDRPSPSEYADLEPDGPPCGRRCRPEGCMHRWCWMVDYEEYGLMDVLADALVDDCRMAA